ncbi:MAG: asparaginase [candidate division Zixibacteria bacterium]|nr:asparaginase [candidate division Zixibacteria bacterium]
MAVPVINVYRGDTVESTHYGDCVVVDSEGKILYQLGDTQTFTYLRSSAKPFQTIPIIESGAAHHFKFTSKEIAIISGSHNGEPQQVEIVSEILDKIGLSPDHLQCGTHLPHYYPANKIEPEPGEKFEPIQHNCSGKHAGMLALCVFKELSLDDYLSPEHPIQNLITEAIASICDYPKKDIKIGIDGCSAPVHGMPIYNMALGFARFVTPPSVRREKAKIYSSIYQAFIEHPDLVAGDHRYDTELMRTCKERLIAKGGAEGLHCVGLPERKWGMTTKVIDGAKRAQYIFSLETLRQLGVVTSEELEKLKEHHGDTLFNWTDKKIGYIKPEFELEKK